MPALLTEGCLKNHPLLEGCSNEFLNHLEEFASEVIFEAGEIIFKEGEYADRFFLICEGSIQLEACTNGDRMLIQTLETGDLLGWSWLFPPFEWHFSARALTRCRAVELNAASLLIRAEEDPVFGYELMKRISKQVVCRLQATRKRLASEIKARRGTNQSAKAGA